MKSQTSISATNSVSIQEHTEPIDESTQNYLGQSMSASTLRAYRSQWQAFVAWCELQDVESMPALPETVARYLASLADRGYKPSSIDVARAAIRKAHETAGASMDPTSSPLVVQTLKGIRRSKGTAPHQKAALLTDDLKMIIRKIDGTTLKGQRDKALLLIGFCLGARRSELVGLDAGDVQEVDEGIIITIRRSKTDQEGAGYEKGIARGEHPETCPVTAMMEYMASANITEGPIFRSIVKGGEIQSERLSAQSVALIIKARVGAAKLTASKYSGHSLRAGMVTQAAKNGASVTDIMQQTGHKSVQTVTRYVRRANILDDKNASRALGL